MYVLLIYRLEADSHEGRSMHREDPFAGIEILAVSTKEITPNQVAEYRATLPNPANCVFHIDQI